MDSKKEANGAITRKRKEALERLRIENQTYCERVTDSINYIETTEPECFSRPSESTLKTYAERLKEQRERMKMSLDEAGRQIGATRTAIEKIENSINQKINKTYLESFSLLFQVSPLYFLDESRQSGEYFHHSPEQDCVLISPIFDFEPDVVQKVQLILWKSYQGDDNLCMLNKRLIAAIAQLCTAKFDWYQSAKSNLFMIPTIKELLDSEVNASDLYKAEIGDNWVDFRDSHLCDKGFSDIQTALCDLGMRDAEMLNLVLHLVFSTEELKHMILYLLCAGGYLEGSKHFRHKDE